MKDYLGYTGKVCVVTGAASGMGKATAEMLVDLGAMVYALDWAEVKVEGITAYLHTDLSKKESIDAAFAQIPDHIDCYFGIAGVSGLGTDFLTTTKIDLISNKYISECILTARMTEGGAIAYMTSTAGIGWEQEVNKRHYLPVVEAEGWDGAVAALEEHGFPGIQEAYRRHCCTLGSRVHVIGTEIDFIGTAEDIDETGALLVRDESGVLQRVLSGDVSVRGVMGYV